MGPVGVEGCAEMPKLGCFQFQGLECKMFVAKKWPTNTSQDLNRNTAATRRDMKPPEKGKRLQFDVRRLTVYEVACFVMVEDPSS